MLAEEGALHDLGALCVHRVSSQALTHLCAHPAWLCMCVCVERVTDGICTQLCMYVHMTWVHKDS